MGKPEVSVEAVTGTREPRMVRTKRIFRHLLSPVPDAVIHTVGEDEAEIKAIPDRNKDLAEFAADIVRDRIDPEALKRGVHMAPDVFGYEVTGDVKSEDTKEAEITQGSFEVVSPAGVVTKFRLHADKLREEFINGDVLPLDASVLVEDPDNGTLYSIGDFHPAERIGARDAMGAVFTDIKYAPDLNLQIPAPEKQLH